MTIRDDRILIKKQYVKLAAGLILLPLILAACLLDRTGGAPVTTSFSAVPAYICPSEASELSWNVPAWDPCYSGRPSADVTTPCSTVTSLTSDNPSITLSVGLDERTGTRTVTPATTTIFTLVTNLIWPESGITVETKTATVHVVAAVEDIPFTAPGTCESNLPIDLRGIVSPCVEVNEICISADNPDESYQIGVAGETAMGSYGGSTDSLRRGDCVTPDDLGLATFEGIYEISATYTPEETPAPAPPGGDIIRGEECLEWREDIAIELHGGCTGAYVGCFAASPEMIVSEPTDKPSDDDDLVQICNLLNSCGDGVCEEGCESALSCAVDCAPDQAVACVDDGVCSADEQATGNCADCAVVFIPSPTPAPEECVDDGICTEGEQAKGSCRDCSTGEGDQCGVPCSGSCSSGLPCVNGVCWEASICDPNTVDPTTGGGDGSGDSDVCVNDGVCTQDEKKAGGCRDCRDSGDDGGSSSGGSGNNNSCPCQQVCTEWSYAVYPAACVQYSYQDCNGKSCNP